MEHPYREYTDSTMWQVIDAAVMELEENDDITLNTAREYVIGYMCKRLQEAFPNSGEKI